MAELVTVDIGGTHARFAVATISDEGAIALSEPITLLNPRTTPAPAPVAGLTVYPRTRAGRTLLDVVGPSGVDTPLQPALFGNRIAVWSPGSGTAITAFGMTPTTAATLSHPTPATTTHCAKRNP